MLNLKSTLFSVTLSLALAASAQGQALRLLVGTYTEGTPAEGVYLYSFDGATAETALLGVAPSGNPSFVIPDPRGGIAYAVNEYSDGREAVSSYEVRGDSIRLLSSVPIPGAEVDGADPCNLLFTGGALVTANYTGGSVTAFPIAGDGQVGAMSQSFSGAAGISHMHCAVLSPTSAGTIFFALCVRRGRSPSANVPSPGSRQRRSLSGPGIWSSAPTAAMPISCANSVTNSSSFPTPTAF